MPNIKKVEATNVASPRVSGWAIVLTWERPDGTWYTETKTDIPHRVWGKLEDYISELEDEKENKLE
jgi:hypothetical protein